MSLKICPVTKDNWRELSTLRVRDDQANFVATNLQSIAEAQFGFDDQPGFGHWDAVSFGIYDENKPVGFFMLGYNYLNPKMQAYVIRLMVDEKFQGRGYGKCAMNWILDHFRGNARVRTLAINYESNNNPARALYASFGFRETGEIEQNGEVVAILQIK